MHKNAGRRLLMHLLNLTFRQFCYSYLYSSINKNIFLHLAYIKKFKIQYLYQCIIGLTPFLALLSAEGAGEVYHHGISPTYQFQAQGNTGCLFCLDDIMPAILTIGIKCLLWRVAYMDTSQHKHALCTFYYGFLK